MKIKIATVILSILLLAAGLGLFAPHRVQAADHIKVILNGQLLQLDESAPYKSGSNLMIPLRETAEALKYTTTYQGSTGQIQLTRVKDTIDFKLSGDAVLLNGKDKVVLNDKIEVRQKRIYVPLSFFNAIGLIASYNPGTGQAEIYAPEVTAGAVTGLLAAGKYQELQERYLSNTASQQAFLQLIQKTWESVAVPAGNYFGMKTTDSHWAQDEMTIQSVLIFAKSEATLTLTVDTTGKITGLTLAPLAASEAAAGPVQ
ncbi:stalk domain-containing protein, partial [Paenibacillus riograndensis]|uniref:Putative secreted protein n=1 Tax=Paenibacillus riograndensis SBR5 TaxID=1073571 RepID=A0A0E4HBF0_9BACL